MKYVFIFLLYVLSFNVIYGQNVDNYIYHAAYIPVEQLQNISIDGKLHEWSWVSDEYKIKDTYLLSSEFVDSSNFSVEFFVAWTPVTDKIYVIAKVKDDIINMNGVSEEEELYLIIDSNRESGSLWSGQMCKHLLLNALKLRIGSYLWIKYGPQWINNQDYLKIHVLPEKDAIYYEIEFNLWNDLSLYSSLLSKPLALSPGMQTGLSLLFVDIDDDKPGVRIRTFSGSGSNIYTDEGSVFVLDPPHKFMNILDDILLFYTE